MDPVIDSSTDGKYVTPYTNPDGVLNEHHRTQHPPVLCSVCKKQFSSPNVQDRHLYSHQMNKSFSCDTCEETFSFESELRNHQIRHHTLRTYICAKAGCDKDFKRKSDLTAYVRTHGKNYLQV